MTQYLPQDIGQWMRAMERRTQALERRRIPSDAWVGSPFTKQVPRWKSRLSGNATIAANTATTIAYSSVYASPQHSPSGQPNDFFSYALVSNQGRITVNVEGLYLVTATLQWAGATGGARKLNLFRNADGNPFATDEAAPSATAAIGVRNNLVAPIALNAGDYIYPTVYSATSSAGIIAAGASGGSGYADSYLSIIPIGALAYTPA